MKKKVTLDHPRSPSLWPEPKITGETPAQVIISTIPNYLERAREALLCIEHRCARAGKAVSGARKATLEGIAGECRAWLPELERMRKDIDGMIAGEKPESGLF